MESAIDGNDRVITAYRCHPAAVLRGGTIKGVISELMGRSLVATDMKLTRHRSPGRHVERQGWIDAHVHSFLLRW